jgi:putative ABC transport system permease protein
MLADLRDAVRQLRKAPGFTATVVITLALGIGATTAIFTLVHQVMLKSLPVTKPEELWRIGDKIRCCNWGGYTQGDDGDFSLFSWEAYKNFREHTPEFADLAALQAGNAPLGVRRAGSQAPVDTRNGQYVSGNFFRTLGVQPWMGRLMTDADNHGRAAGRGDELPRLGEQVRLRPSVVGAKFPDQWTRVHRHRSDSARVLWRQAIGLGHAGLLDTDYVRAGSCHGCGADQASQRKLS